MCEDNKWDERNRKRGKKKKKTTMYVRISGFADCESYSCVLSSVLFVRTQLYTPSARPDSLSYTDTNCVVTDCETENVYVYTWYIANQWVKQAKCQRNGYDNTAQARLLVLIEEKNENEQKIVIIMKWNIIQMTQGHQNGLLLLKEKHTCSIKGSRYLLRGRGNTKETKVPS